MDTMEFQRLVGALDGQLADLKRQEEDRKRREALQQRLKLVDYWIEGLQRRLEEITLAGAVPVVDVEAKLDELVAERQSLAAGLELKPDMEAEDRKEILSIAEEIAAFAGSGWSPQERWLTYESWACRWKIVAERLAPGVVDREPAIRACYARIREAMKSERAPMWFIKALDRNEKGLDWRARLEEVKAQIAALAADRAAAARKAEEEERKDSAREEAQDAAVWNLAAAVRGMSEALEKKLHGLPKGDELAEEAERKLRHCLRQAGRFDNLREEAADMARVHRTRLEPEFSFLWPKAEEAEAPPPARRMTNGEIAARLLRRMKSKGLIGACHGPFDMMFKGFPEHDKGRAKEAIELLAKTGVVRSRSKGIGVRVSIEAKMVPVADRIVDGASSGIEALDGWLKEQA